MTKSPHIVIVGGSAAGPAAAVHAKKMNPHARVNLIEAGEHIAYSACSAPYYVGGVISDFEKLIFYSPEIFSATFGCEVKTRHRAIRLNPHRRKLIVQNDAGEIEIPYDEIILACGARAAIPDPAWLSSKNVFTMKALLDAKSIRTHMETSRPTRATIVGGGFVGMEMTEALAHHGLDITVVSRAELPMPGLENAAQKIVLDELQKNGIKFISNMNFKPAENEMTILATGFKPNTDWLDGSKIRTGKFGGILTDARMRTNLEHVYACGAITEIKNLVTNKYVYLPLATIANQMGRVAGANASGSFMEFGGIVPCSVVKIFGLEVVSVGVSSREAENNALSAEVEVFSGFTRGKLFSQSKAIFIALIYEPKSHRILGANILGEEGAVLRGNLLAAAIRRGETLSDLAEMDFAYTPYLSAFKEPLVQAARRAMKK